MLLFVRVMPRDLWSLDREVGLIGNIGGWEKD